MTSGNPENTETQVDRAEPQGPDFVLDQNEMRRGALRRLTQRSGPWRLILPDTSIIEMSKSDAWQYTMRRSFNEIVHLKDRVFGTISVGEAIRYERDEQKPITRAGLIDDKVSAFFRDLIEVMTSSHRYPGRIAALQDAMGHMRPAVALVETNPEKAKAEVIAYTESFQKDAGKGIHKGLRNRAINKQAQLGLLRVALPYILKFSFPELKTVDTARLETEKPFTFRFVCLKMLNAMRWARDGGLNTAKPSKVLNGLLDLEYALFASFFDGLLSKDKIANENLADLQSLLDVSQRQILLDAFRAYLQTSRRAD